MDDNFPSWRTVPESFLIQNFYEGLTRKSEAPGHGAFFTCDCLSVMNGEFT
ncbi:MAG: hypothetical protein U1E57_04030 [Paenacidovorax caeni]